MNFVLHIEDTRGDLVDIAYYYGAFCFERDTGTIATGHAWPCLESTDSDIYYEGCGCLIQKGLEADDDA